MQKIALITDSSCDLDKETLEKFNIKMLPVRIVYKDAEYLDKIELSSEEMYNRLAEEVPTTSLPDVGYSHKVLEQIVNDGFTHVIVATVSSKLSGTFNSLRLIGEEFEELKFHYFDTRTLGYPVGAIAIQIAKLIEAKESFEEIVSKLESIRERVHGYITFSTLEYLIKGGRIGRVTGTIGKVLDLKPIVSSNEEGVLYNFSKARGRKKAISKMKEILNDYLDKGKCRVWVLSGHALEEATAFFEDFKAHSNITEISLEQIGAGMGVHTGPGALGMCVLQEI